MTTHTTTHQHTRLIRQLNITLFVAALLLISNVILTYWVGYAFVHTRTILVPITLKRSATVSNFSVDATYLEAVGLALLQERYTVSPDTVHQQYETLLHHTDPRFYAAFKKALDTEEASIQREQFSSVFYTQKVIPNPKALRLSVTGRLKRFVGALGLPEKRMRYTVQFKLIDGRVWLSHINTQEIKS